MSREKQIEEMARAIGELYKVMPKDIPPHDLNIATYLYDKGYRKNEWISVDERLPEREGYYLIFTSDGLILTDIFLSRFNLNVSHWMPIPEPPTTEKGGGEG